LDKNTQDIKAFDCGKPKMNAFLSRFAFKHSKLGLSSTWVLLEQVDSKQNNEKNKIAAYYTLASSTVIKSEIPSHQSLPHYPIPVVLLARLAVDKQYQGEGLGAKLLVTALRHTVELTNQGLPAYGLVLDVLDDDALSFYRYFDFFEPFTDDPMRLFIGMDSIKKL
jgi:GNAT superfamily N-acetyltransferase